MQIKSIESYREEETYQIGYEMGCLAKEGDIYSLSGDLGVGKTVFAKGFAKGLGIEDIINSPTFTILQVYESGRIPFYHFDVYRIGCLEEMDEIGYEEYFFGNGVCLIEWAELVKELLPDTIKQVIIQKDLSVDFDYRKIEVREGKSK